MSDYYEERSPDGSTPPPSNKQTPRPNFPEEEGPNRFAALSLAASLLSYVLCCCNPYLMIAGCILSIALAVISKVLIEPQKRMHKQAVGAIIISAVGLILIVGSILYVYTVLPGLLTDNPEFRQNFYDLLRQAGIDPSGLGL